MSQFAFARRVTAFTLFLFVAGCASGPEVRVTADPAANLAAYRTFNYVSPLGTDREGYESIVSTALKEATTAELTRRGYRLAGEPDFLVNFGARLDDRLRVTKTPVAGPRLGYYGYRWGFYDPWYGYNDVDVDQYTEGTVNIDIVDAGAKRLVWETVAVGRVTEKTMKDVPGAIRKLVPQMLATLPSAGGGAAPEPPAH
ncbi:MAG: DUF4136 domain-containing protein [Steroidobacteraceae bacterium]